ncbi:MAG: metal-dependent hydrolase [Acidobacteria bacterium]|nr:metal-dependent hydrolase [Acidobacteriota bacterium]
MDNLTHTLFAATLARTPLAHAGRGTTAALLLASNAPDIDIVATAGGAVSYLKWHRAFTHGPIGIVGLGVATAGLVWAGRRLWDRRNGAAGRGAPDAPNAPDASFGMLVAVSIIGVLFHVLMDLPTSYGSRILSPFDWHWYAWDWMPIVDIYLLIILGSGLFISRASADARRRNATIVLVMMAANYGVRAVGHRQALALVPRIFGPTLPAPCGPDAPQTLLDWWPRPASPAAPAMGTRCLVEAAALPSFSSPFSWRIVAQFSNAYELRDIDILDARLRGVEDDGDAPWRTNVRYPNVWTPTVRTAASTPTAQVFLGFSRFPAARSAEDAQHVTTVRFTDVRFVAGPAPVNQPIRRDNLFTASVHVSPDGRVLDEAIGR